ncbi:hypothetical protein L0F51_10615 [Afifella sp. H1R]|uniref:YiiX/YebB-like N1pC/P60 family cysteine hydrolase n=1 Tax=Afifella sp. H1R TaxID=2908841 RepID=UPI001F1675C2|nr:YiiX/YebB-like N1pC/P60 family cysteine hydrolase [Afifella sp. H1R]MCF1504215.1 hypothetical protein [Afifella sp. H1R]
MTMTLRRCLSLATAAAAAIAAAALSFSVSAFAESGESIVDRYFFDKNPPSGALIFQQRDGLEGTALTLATESPYTHVGIIRITGGGPYVMQSSPETLGVDEMPLEDFIEAGVDQKFAIYVTKKDYRPAGQLNSPASLAAYDYYYFPYDHFYRPDSEAVYSAELIFKIFRDIGHPIGHMRKIADLNFDTEAGRRFLLNDWRARPECQSGGMSRQACWERIQAEAIVTPKDLAEDGKLKLYLTTF